MFCDRWFWYDCDKYQEKSEINNFYNKSFQNKMGCNSDK